MIKNMNSEKVKEIKKALEQNDDNGIMYEVNDQKRTCKFIHHKDILTYINELEKENAIKTDTIVDLLKKQEFYEKEKLTKFAERLKKKAIRRQEFIGELAIDDIEYVKTQDIDKTLEEFINNAEI